MEHHNTLTDRFKTLLVPDGHGLLVRMEYNLLPGDFSKWHRWSTDDSFIITAKIGRDSGTIVECTVRLPLVGGPGERPTSNIVHMDPFDEKKFRVTVCRPGYVLYVPDITLLAAVQRYTCAEQLIVVGDMQDTCDTPSEDVMREILADYASKKLEFIYKFSSLACEEQLNTVSIINVSPSVVGRTSCPICLVELEGDALVLDSCKHMFCFQCLPKWMELGNATCPYCRQLIWSSMNIDGQTMYRRWSGGESS